MGAAKHACTYNVKMCLKELEEDFEITIVGDDTEQIDYIEAV